MISATATMESGRSNDAVRRLARLPGSVFLRAVDYFYANPSSACCVYLPSPSQRPVASSPEKRWERAFRC